MSSQLSYTGVIKRYQVEKGYGFIAPQDGSKDVFFHHSALGAGVTVQEGQKVTFSVIQTPKGRQAESISVID